MAENNKSEAGTVNDCAGAYPFLDWTATVVEGTAGLRSQRCRGSYLDPLRDLDTTQDPATANIEATAARSEMQGDIIRLSGGVEARQGYRLLRGSEAEYDRQTGLGELLGEVEIREPGLLMRGSTGSFNSVTGETRLTANQFVLHEEHLRGGADLVVRRPNGIIELSDGYYSYCPPLSDNWLLRAEDISLDLEEGVGTARNAKIEMEGVPILYTPYLQFPLDDRRRSGFLWPEVGNDSNGGLDIAAPYYFNLAPNYDATLTPRYIADRGLLTELELRYLSNRLGSWEFGGAWIGDDDEYRSERPDRNGDRWLAAIDQRGLFGQRWRTRIDFTKTGDDQYFNDIGTTSLQRKQSTHLLQTGEIDYLGNDWLATLRVEEFQTIARDVRTEPYSKLPQLTLRRAVAQQNFAPNFLLTSDYAYFEHDDRITGHRLFNEVGATWPMEWIWGFLTPTAKYRQLNYELDDAIAFDGRLDDRPDVGTPLLSLDGGLFFERETAWGLQTLEPRLFYLWSDFENQAGLPDFDTNELTFTYNQLFRDTRFSGHDRLDDANQLTVGLTSRLIDPASGSETISVSVGQIFYFDDRLVSVGSPSENNFEGSSAIAAEVSLAADGNWQFRSSWLWNTDREELDQSIFRLSWQGEDRTIFNLGYSFRRSASNPGSREDIQQIDLSTFYPITREWSVFFRALYDLEEGERLNDMAGFEYNNCCWRVRLVYQRYIDQKSGQFINELVEYENATYVEFQLKGFGGVGTRVSDMLEEFIRGYNDSDL